MSFHVKTVMGALALAGLLSGASTSLADCKQGTICRKLIQNGFKTCQKNIQNKWRAIRNVCKAAKRAKNSALCLRAIAIGFQTAATESVAAADCPPGYPNVCDDVCCPDGFPVCPSQSGCPDVCCPGDHPVCGDDKLCYQQPGATTTTIVNSCPIPTTTLPSTGCANSGDICSTSGCSGLPSGSCSLRCPGRSEFACIGFVASFSTCTSDSDCPAENPLCVGRGSDDTCTPPGGICAAPCQ
jgi:hypothetical protein